MNEKRKFYRLTLEIGNMFGLAAGALQNIPSADEGILAAKSLLMHELMHNGKDIVEFTEDGNTEGVELRRISDAAIQFVYSWLDNQVGKHEDE